MHCIALKLVVTMQQHPTSQYILPSPFKNLLHFQLLLASCHTVSKQFLKNQAYSLFHHFSTTNSPQVQKLTNFMCTIRCGARKGHVNSKAKCSREKHALQRLSPIPRYTTRGGPILLTFTEMIVHCMHLGLLHDTRATHHAQALLHPSTSALHRPVLALMHIAQISIEVSSITNLRMHLDHLWDCTTRAQHHRCQGLNWNIIFSGFLMLLKMLHLDMN